MTRIGRQGERGEMQTKSRLDELARYLPDWDGAGAPAPNAQSIGNARKIADELEARNLHPDKIAVSVEGGIGFTFKAKVGRAYIECDNDGEIFVAIYGAELPAKTWRVPDGKNKLLSAIGKIEELLTPIIPTGWQGERGEGEPYSS